MLMLFHHKVSYLPVNLIISVRRPVLFGTAQQSLPADDLAAVIL